MKQQHHHYQPEQVLYQKQQLPYYDPTVAVKSSKYAELFNNPHANYGFGGGVDMYPVDVVNTIPNTTSTSKFDSSSSEAQNGSASNSGDLDSMVFGKPDMDFGALLSMLTPDNKLNDLQPSDPSSYLIPNLDFLSDASPQQPKFADGFDTTTASLGSYDIPTLENANALPGMVDDQTFWEGMEKTSSAPSASRESPPTNLPLALDVASPMDDPFMTELLNDEPILNFPPDESRYDQTATPTSDVFSTGLADEPSPLPASAQSSPITPASGNGDIATTLMDDNLQDLFEKTIDLSDMMELDFMLPPPAKRRPQRDLSLRPLPSEGEKEWHDVEPIHREVKMEPKSPEATQLKSPVVVSPVEVDATSERGGGSKGKSTILFGKHEDEIIHKLLAPQPGAHAKPVSRDKLVSMPVEEFNQLLEQASLSEIEVAFMKEWRRRGKNKAAAQIARKRKREEVSDLEGEVKALRKQKAELNKKYDRLRSQIATLKKRSMAAEDRVYRQQTRLTGKAVSRDTHLIHLTDDDKLLLVPRIRSQVLTISK